MAAFRLRLLRKAILGHREAVGRSPQPPGVRHLSQRLFLSAHEDSHCHSPSRACRRLLTTYWRQTAACLEPFPHWHSAEDNCLSLLRPVLSMTRAHSRVGEQASART